MCIRDREKRQRYDNVPYGDAMRHLSALAFGPAHPYGHTTIGSMADLDAATPERAAAFFANHYRPEMCIRDRGEGVLSLGANGYHTCAVTDSGAVKCWGLNEHGQLGDGSTTGSLVPVDVVGLGAGIRSVAAGYEHTCAVTTAGAVKCWGANESGELGDGSTTDRLAPVDVQGLAADVVSVTAGGDYSGGQTCALMATGSIVCWGNNGSGQLGDGTTTNRSTPTTVTARGPGYQAVSAGDEHVCALTSEGEVQCLSLIHI